jgi:hypothetical protein
MSKEILIIKACGVPGEEHECRNIQTQAQMYGINTTVITPKSVDQLKTGLSNNVKYDYIYLSSHGSPTGLCNHDKSLDISWFDFGVLLCESMCMKENCILMLSCCRGGLNEVAYDLFYCCEKISYIVGPRQSLPPTDMLISFNLLLYTITFRGLDPIVACEKIKAGTDIRFVCFDKLEVQSDLAYIMRMHSYSEGFNEQLKEAKKKANEPMPQMPRLETISD